jgi:predicted glycoside hydrolase/deacetylase ChbG (UPF0249 family)
VSRILIVNADDFGRTPGVSAGIRRAHQSGIVTTATVMANIPGADDAVRLALEETPGLELGVHLTLTFGPACAPEAQVPSLLQGGRLRSLQDLLHRPETLALAQVEREWRAQIEALLRAGAELDHLDSHHHIALLRPDLWNLCLALAAEYGVGVRPPWPADADVASLTAMLPPAIRDFASTEAVASLRASSTPSPDHFFGGFFGPSARLPHLTDLLRELPEGVSELMTHPGVADAALTSASGYARERETELLVLTHPELPALLDRFRIELATYRAIWASS